MTQIIRIGFTGTRNGMTSLQIRGVHAYMLGTNRVYESNREVAGIEGHHGDCLGADHEFHVLAVVLGWRTFAHPPDNYRVRAWCRADVVLPERDYLERDRDIVLAADGGLLAAPAGTAPEPHSGTWATIRFAVRAGRPATIIFPDGRMAYGTEFFPAAA